jgi:hypothetical protein
LGAMVTQESSTGTGHSCRQPATSSTYLGHTPENRIGGYSPRFQGIELKKERRVGGICAIYIFALRALVPQHLGLRPPISGK